MSYTISHDGTISSLQNGGSFCIHGSSLDCFNGCFPARVKLFPTTNEKFFYNWNGKSAEKEDANVPEEPGSDCQPSCICSDCAVCRKCVSYKTDQQVGCKSRIIFSS